MAEGLFIAQEIRKSLPDKSILLVFLMIKFLLKMKLIKAR